MSQMRIQTVLTLMGFLVFEGMLLIDFSVVACGSESVHDLMDQTAFLEPGLQDNYCLPVSGEKCCEDRQELGVFNIESCVPDFGAHPSDCTQGCETPGLFENLTFFTGLDGSKQPQDFGVNANFGGQFHVNWGTAILPEYGVGMQIGTSLVRTTNAVRVYELLGESTDRTQSYTTLGLFQRLESGWSWGVVYDHLYENSFDRFRLSQWRLRSSYLINDANEVGVSVALSGASDVGSFGATQVHFDAINQGNIFWRHYWESSAQTTFWLGLAEGHGESNAVTGFSPDKEDAILVGADVLMPLNDHFVLYGETNLIMPPDTGTVDAFLGIQWYPWGGGYQNRRKRFAPYLPMASTTQMSIDLLSR